jgi:hypothetical protein
MTSNVGAKMIMGGGRNGGMFLRPGDDEQEATLADSNYARTKVGSSSLL